MPEPWLHHHTRRAALAELAAGRLLAGREPSLLLPRLRLCWLAEQLCAAPPPRALELDAELEALCGLLGDCVCRRPGWLYYRAAEVPLPVAVPPGLLQAVLFCYAEGLLRTPGACGLVRVEVVPGAARLTLHGGDFRSMPADCLPLLRRLAAVAGGCCVAGGASFVAAVRLPLCPHLPCRAPTDAAAMLRDRYSPLYLCLGGRGLIAEDV